MKWEDVKNSTEKKESLFDRQMRISWEFDRNFNIETMSAKQLDILEKAMEQIKALKK